MKNLLALGTLLFAAAAFAGPQEAGKPAQACEKQHAQCMKQCDKEKTAWFFKGEAYDSCAEKCEARNESCAATGTGEAMNDKARQRGNHEHADATTDATDTEDQPQAEEIPESEDAAAEANESKGKGKDRAGDRGRKDKDRDAAEDDGAMEDDE